MPQSHACPTGDQEVAGLNPSWIWQHSLYGHSLSSADPRRVVVSFWQKDVHKYWLTAWKTGAVT